MQTKNFGRCDCGSGWSIRIPIWLHGTGYFSKFWWLL